MAPSRNLAVRASTTFALFPCPSVPGSMVALMAYMLELLLVLCENQVTREMFFGDLLVEKSNSRREVIL